MNVFNNVAYGLAIGVVRALEAKLIKFDEFLKLKACGSVDEFVFELKNLNYSVSNFSNSQDFNSKLNSEFNKLVFELKKICPSFAPFNLVFFENDCFNLKVSMFSKKMGFSGGGFVLKPGFLPVNLVESCGGNFCCLPFPFSNLAIELNRLLSLNCSNFEVLAEFNKKKFELKQSLCKFNEFLFERTKLEIDVYNCGLVLKALKLNLNEFSLKKVLVVGGLVDSNLIFEAFSNGISSLSKFFNLAWGFNLNNMLSDVCVADEMFFKKVSDFDFKMSCLPFSFAAIVAYLNKLQWEHKNLKQILVRLNFSGG